MSYVDGTLTTMSSKLPFLKPLLNSLSLLQRLFSLALKFRAQSMVFISLALLRTFSTIRTLRSEFTKNSGIFDKHMRDFMVVYIFELTSLYIIIK